MALAEHRPSGWLRVAFRLPIWIYRLGLGRILDHRLLLIVHRGRKSRLLREAVVEVVRYDRASHACVVMAGWHGTTDWYRNVQAEPALEIRVGRERFAPAQRFLTTDETIAELRSYVERHPRLARQVLGRAFGVTLDGSEESWQAAADFFRGVRFEPMA